VVTATPARQNLGGAYVSDLADVFWCRKEDSNP
jgi:hypothetical protein